MTYFYETGSAKAECVADYIVKTYFDEEATPIKILLFAHHTNVMDTYEGIFKLKVKFQTALTFYFITFRKSKRYGLMAAQVVRIES